MESDSSLWWRLQISAILKSSLEKEVQGLFWFDLFVFFPLTFHNKCPLDFCVIFKTEVQYFIYLLEERNSQLLFDASVDNCWLPKQPCLMNSLSGIALLPLLRGGLETVRTPSPSPSARTFIQNLSGCYWLHMSLLQVTADLYRPGWQFSGQKIRGVLLGKEGSSSKSHSEFCRLRRPATIPLMIENGVTM